MFGSEDYVVTVCFGPDTCIVQFDSTITIEKNYFLYSYHDIVTFYVDRCLYHTAFVTYVTFVLAHICGSLLAPSNIRYCTCVFWQTLL